MNLIPKLQKLASKWSKSIPNLVGYAIILIFCLTFIWYVLYDNTPPHWDAGRHLSNLFNYWITIKNGIFQIHRSNALTDGIRGFAGFYGYYPPMVYYVAMPFMVLFGRNYNVAVASNISWILLLFLSTYFLLKEFKIKPIANWITLCFLASSPFIIGNSRELQLDIPLLALLIFIIYRFELYIQNSNKKNLLLASVSIGLGLMVKWTFIVFAPLIILAWSLRLFTVQKLNKTSISNFIQLTISSILATLAFSGHWYLNSLTQLKMDLTQNGGKQGIAEGDPQGFTWASFDFYKRAISYEHFTLIWQLILVLAVAGIASAIIFRRVKQKVALSSLKNLDRNKLFLFGFSCVLFLVMLVYHMLQGNKDIRYVIIFYVSYIGILAVILDWCFEYCSKYLNWVITSLAIFSFCLMTIYMNSPVKLPELAWNYPDNPIVIAKQSGYTNRHAQNKNWAINNLMVKASNYRKLYNGRADTCRIDKYWIKASSIFVDFDSMPTHSNYGTVWGLAQAQEMQIVDGPKNTCFVAFSRMNQTKTALEELATKSDVYKDYIILEYYSDWQGQNMLLLAKK